MEYDASGFKLTGRSEGHVSRRESAQSPSLHHLLPEVTISQDAEVHLQPARNTPDHSLLAAPTPAPPGFPELDWYGEGSGGTRIIRSHSLTTAGSDQRSTVGSDWSTKIRSNSITFGAKDSFEEASCVTEGLGSRDLREWMKSLRLHKYSDRLQGYGYDEVLALKDEDLHKLLFTDGAKGKLLKQISLIKERPAKIREMKKKLEGIKELKELLNFLPDLEKLILMPLKISTTITRPRRVSGEAMVELDEAKEVFGLLECTFSAIICKQHDDTDNDKVVRTFFNLLERRCLKKESFNNQQRQMFVTWLRRMDQVWDISRTVKVEAARKMERRPSRESILRRSSLQPPSPAGSSLSLASASSSLSLGSPCPRSMSPFASPQPPMQPRCISPYQERLTQPTPPLPPAQASAHPIHEVVITEASDEPCPDLGVGFGPGPDLDLLSLSSTQFKRNSYQGDMRMPPLVDSEILSGFNDFHHHPRGLSLTGAQTGPLLSHSPSSSSSFSSQSSSSRRASTLSTSSWDSGFSRRSSTMSTSGGDSGSSRRNSSISDDSYRSDSYLCSGGERRDSMLATCAEEDPSCSGRFLTVESAVLGVRKSSFGAVGSERNPNLATCTEEVPDKEQAESLEHDLHTLTMAVTEKALLE